MLEKLKRAGNFIKITIYRGIIFILPLTILLLILDKIFQSLKKFAEPYVQSIGIQTIFGKFTVIIVVILLNLTIFFIAGLLLKFRFAKRIHQQVETVASKYIPGYDKMLSKSKKIIDEKLNPENNPYDAWKCYLIKVNLSWKPVFIVNDKAEILTLFYSTSPNPLTGNVEFILRKDFNSLEKIPAETKEIIPLLKKYGVGVSELLFKENNS